MQEETFTLETMLSAFYKIKGTQASKRLIFDQSNLNGIGSKWIKIFFISLPILLYVGIFNPTIFNMLGIAQAIIFYVVFLSMVMIMIVGLTFINNNKVIRQITPSWNVLFPTVDLMQVLSSGATPYKDFVKHYHEALKQDLTGDTLHDYLSNSFTIMQEENTEIYEAMNRTNQKR